MSTLILLPPTVALTVIVVVIVPLLPSMLTSSFVGSSVASFVHGHVSGVSDVTWVASYERVPMRSVKSCVVMRYVPRTGAPGRPMSRDGAANRPPLWAEAVLSLAGACDRRNDAVLSM